VKGVSFFCIEKAIKMYAGEMVWMSSFTSYRTVFPSSKAVEIIVTIHGLTAHWLSGRLRTLLKPNKTLQIAGFLIAICCQKCYTIYIKMCDN